jgi:hypothetical protein
LSRERRRRLSSESKTCWAIHLGPILDTDAELHGKKSRAHSIANLGEGDAIKMLLFRITKMRFKIGKSSTSSLA